MGDENELPKCAEEISTAAWCPYCGATNTFPGFAVVEKFVCAECGETVEVPASAQ
jgi:uncharacterized protein (DUF983 family)